GRSMRRVSLLVAATLLITLVAPGAATGWAAPVRQGAARPTAAVDPLLQGQLDAAGPGRMVEAIVVLKSQADLTSVRGMTRKSRPGAGVRTRRARAAPPQRGLRALLERRRAQGKVTSTEPLWIVTAIAVTAPPGVIKEIAARRDVREIR